LDGFIAGANDDVQRLFAWMFQGTQDLTLKTGEHDIDLKVSEQSIDMFEQAMNTNGAILAGRHLFDVAGAWGGKHPMNVPVVVLTHNIPQEWVYEGSTFTFVTDGIESALKQAQQIAGDKQVAVASSTLVQQCLKLGLLDEIHIDLVPVLLGQGTRLFDHLETPIELELIKMVQAPGVTHMTYRVVK
ncbi:MAG TPA: dihydrofolate reductase family protein, partial [Phototrophicaceae bacterium]|nr:dihydrofolate reductase family protein [Phototrophicaceae bacterium]